MPSATFACAACDSPAISVEGDITPSARVSCQRCGAFVSTWADYLARVAETLAQHGTSSEAIDPLPAKQSERNQCDSDQ